MEGQHELNFILILKCKAWIAQLHTEIKETYVQSRVRTDLQISTTEHQIEAERNPWYVKKFSC